ncbi:MAG: hypothetical protein QME28_06985 [Candidatus Saccharicenans sp.]|nr:hypothetical protein [Candidatus Saccharicenans sp.]
MPASKESRFVFCLIFSLIILLASSCSRAPEVPVAGKAVAQDMLTLLPADTSAFLVADWNRLMNLKIVEKVLSETGELEGYRKKAEAFVNLKNDVFLIAVAIIGDINRPAENAVLLANLKYDRSKLLPSENQEDSTLEFYQDLPYFPFIEIEESAVACLAFLDGSNIAIGSEKAVKKIIDVYRGNIPDLYSNKQIKPFLKDLNMNSLTFSWLTFPPGLMEAESGENPALKLLTKVRHVSSFTHYRQQSYQLEIKIYAGAQADLKQIADTLLGLKALGLGLSGEIPEISQALNSLEITLSQRYVKIYINLREELLENFKKILKEKMPEAREKPSELFIEREDF